MRDFSKILKHFFDLRKRAEHLTLKSTLHRFLKRLFAIYRSTSLANIFDIEFQTRVSIMRQSRRTLTE